MTALAAVMLMVAEERVFPVAGTVPLALLALVGNERWRVLRISHFWSNCLGIAAVLFNAVEFLGQDLEGRLLSGAHLLVYLTWITMFQEKTPRQYWWLLVLGLLQVAFGSILTISGWYGVLLCLYLVMAMWTLSVFSLYCGGLQFGGVASLEGEDSSRVGIGAVPNASSTTAPAVPPPHVPTLASTVQNSIQHDARERWINLRFVAGVIGMSFAGLLLGLAFFLFVPRLWIGRPNEIATALKSGGRTLTGFTEEVRLGDLGRILESSERVMQVRIVDHDTSKPISIQEFASRFRFAEPLFRGIVLDTYHNGQWSVESASSDIRSLGRTPARGMVRQEIRLEPIGTDVLFAMRPIDAGLMATYRSERIFINTNNSALAWSRRGNEAIHYEIYSRPQPVDTPAGEPIRFRDGPKFPNFGFVRQLWFYLQFPHSGLDRLKALSQELTAPDRLPPARGRSQPLPLRQALALEAYLKQSGNYSYTLSQGIQDHSIDAVEDFLFNRKSGHCEYYASALTLMLRAIDIPSRMISGFKGMSENKLGGYYEVQQRHAHTWVEAFVEDDWIVLDPTPSAREDAVNSLESGMALFRNIESFLSAYWSSYVVSLSLNRQQEAVYEPLQRSVNEGLGAVGLTRRQTRGLRAWFRQLYTQPEKWFSWQGGLTGAALVLLFGGLIRLVQVAVRLARRMRGTESTRDGALRMRIEFYEQFLKTVGAIGLAYGPEQTQREFATQVEQTLAPRLAPAGLLQLPSELTALYYRVRFGGSVLADDELADVRRQLEDFEACLRTAGNAPLEPART